MNPVDELVACREPFLIGVRHHSPALAIAVPRLLDDFAPDVLAVELPTEAAGWLDLLTHPEAEAPLALAFSRAAELAFYPFADFSPELSALRWARSRDVPVVCIDLPVAERAGYAEQPPEDEQSPEDEQPAEGGRPAGDDRGVRALRGLARSDDSQEIWDRLVEARAPGASAEELRVAALAHGWALRVGSAIDPLTAAREAHMARAVAAEALSGRRVAAVVGSFHAAALAGPAAEAPDVQPRAQDDPPPVEQPAGPDDVAACLVPYTFAQLDSRSGYPSGIRDPAWQQAVCESRLDAHRIRSEATAFVTRITRELRAVGLPAGPAEAAETARMALDLASFRGLAAPSRRELIEAATTVLAQGEVLGRGRAVAEALERVLVGRRRGRVAPGTPQSPLRARIVEELRALRIDPDAPVQLSLTPLRGSTDLACSVLLTRLSVGGIVYASRAESGTWRGAKVLATTWSCRWSPSTDASIELAAARGLTPEQVATSQLLTTVVSGPDDAARLLLDAAGCASGPGVRRALQVIAPLAATAGFADAVALGTALAEVGECRVPGAELLPEGLARQAIELRSALTAAAVRELGGIAGSDNPDDALALAVFSDLGRERPLTLRAALRRMLTEGSPLMQGAAAGVLLDEADAVVPSWLVAHTPEARRALSRRIVGLLAAAGPRFDTAPATLALVDRVNGLADAEFVALLPALRGGFDCLSERAREQLLGGLAHELGRARALTLSPDDALAAARYDVEARERLAALGLSDVSFSPAERWRLVLARERSRLSQQGARMASALDELYGRDGADALDPAQRAAGDGPSQLGVREWRSEIEALFGPGEVTEIFAEAASGGRGDLLEQLPPDEVRPSVELLTTALSLTGALSEARLARLRPLVARLVAELSTQLAVRLQPALTGLATGRPTRRRTGRLDLPRTLRANLRHVVEFAGRAQVVPVHPVFSSPMERQVDWHLILLVDVSGSMSESVVFSALTAAILAGSPCLSVQFLAFDTSVIDFTGHVSDPLKLLLEVKVGGGTDIASALRVARSRVKVPARTLLVLISDFDENGPVAPLLAEVEQLRSSGVHQLGCAALSDSGRGVYNVGVAAQVAGAGMRVAALSPLDLAHWVGTVIREGSR